MGTCTCGGCQAAALLLPTPCKDKCPPLPVTHCHILPARLSLEEHGSSPRPSATQRCPHRQLWEWTTTTCRVSSPCGSLPIMSPSGQQWQPWLPEWDGEDQEMPHLSWSYPHPRGASGKAGLLPRQSKPAFLVRSQNKESWDLATLGQLLLDLHPYFFSHLN